MRGPEVVVVSSYPPRSCGIATYAQDVVTGVTGAGTPCKVISIDDGPELLPAAPEVWRRLRYDDRAAYRAMAQEIDAQNFATVALQHEFGLFGGADGEWLLDFFDGLVTPVVTTLHTVVPNPSDNQRRIIRQLIARSRDVIVLSEISNRLLRDVYGVVEPIIVIQHGVPDVPFSQTAEAKERFGFGLAGRPVVSTFGLMSRGKGIEYAIEAINEVKTHIPDVLYVIAGRTHPKVFEHEGEGYRVELRSLLRSYDLNDNVMFIDQFLTLQDLLGLLAASDVYFTPYINRDQVVSGTLAYAIGAGKAVLSTPYVYAEELLADQRGMLCGFGDVKAMAEKLTLLLSNHTLRAQYERKAYTYGRQMTWPQVSLRLASIYSARESSPPLVLAANS